MTDTREVELKVAVGTTGAESIEALGRSFGDLAADGKALPAVFAETAAQLDKLTQKTDELRSAETVASAAVRGESAALAAKRDDLSRLRIESDKATRGTAEFQAAERALKLALLEGNASLREKKDALAQASTAAKAAAGAEAALRTDLAGAAEGNRRAGDAAKTAGVQQVAAGEAAGSAIEGIGDRLRSIQQAAAAVIGGDLLGGVIGSVAKTADAFANLQARIKLVTGEGEVFDAAFQGVQDIAQRTGASLEATGELFARIAAAGKDIGVSNEAALALTETINQALVVSGASATASNAAITQLVQGLGSGVLRGDEFNSVMEQSPRLAKALADGLGVTTGQLRKLAEAGELSSAKVIESLQGQSAALKAEFDTLPLTIGRSIQTLSNAWLVYVGTTNDAVRSTSLAAKASEIAASAIGLVARNLDTLGQLLYAAGKAAPSPTRRSSSRQPSSTSAPRRAPQQQPLRQPQRRRQPTPRRPARTPVRMQPPLPAPGASRPQWGR